MKETRKGKPIGTTNKPDQKLPEPWGERGEVSGEDGSVSFLDCGDGIDTVCVCQNL